MKGTLRPRVKICCISSREEALTAIEFGASALGLVGNMPSGPGVILDEDIRDIAQIVPPPISTFLLTSETDAKRVIQHYQKVNTNTIQICDELEKGTFDQIRDALPHIKLVQVIHVIDDRSVEQAVKASESVDAILLDSGNPNFKNKRVGRYG